MRPAYRLALALVLAVGSVSRPGLVRGNPPGVEAARPNVIVVLVDDMGWSDLGCFGGEISTPHLDRLATEGIRLAQFYDCAKCETTRASLLSGRYHHEVGIAQLGGGASIAEQARAAGYQTWISGKWHLDGNPLDHGFDRFFGHLSGATNYFRGDASFRIDREPYAVPSEGFYTTDADTDHAIEFVTQRDRERPFFLYLAYNAPHYPLQAPREDVERYLDLYREGWDVVRERRWRRLSGSGLVGADITPAVRPDDVPAWDSLDESRREREVLVMATYAAMVDRLDRNLGRLRTCLEDESIAHDTLILFLSDNGACPFQRTKPETVSEMRMPWEADSYWTYDKGWAHACNTPWREYKRNQHEGGIRSPCIAWWPDGIRSPGRISQDVGHVVDILPTLLDVAGIDIEDGDTTDGDTSGAIPLRGRSLRPIFEGLSIESRGPLFFTFYGTHNAIREGDWKLVNRDRGTWELYDLAHDPAERVDLAPREPMRARAMRQTWLDWARESGVPRPGQADRATGIPASESDGSGESDDRAAASKDRS